jgi:hypothetical protein
LEDRALKSDDSYLIYFDMENSDEERPTDPPETKEKIGKEVNLKDFTRYELKIL